MAINRGDVMNNNVKTAFRTRQYMLSKDFEIYYYSDINPVRMSEHEHDYYEFYFFLEGDMSIVVNGESFLLEPGDVVLIPPKVKHYAEIHSNIKPYRRIVFWISKEYCDLLEEESTDYVYVMQQVLNKGEYTFHNDMVSFNAIQSKVVQLIETIHSEEFGSRTKTDLCVKDLVLLVNRIVYERENGQQSKDGQALYEAIVFYLQEHLDEEVSLEQLAGEFYMSKYHIAHIFKENVGISIHQYLIKKRLAACKDAMSIEKGINEICHQFGFKEYSGFYRAFRKEYGISPKEYKERIQALHRNKMNHQEDEVWNL